MIDSVGIETVRSRQLAAVRREVTGSQVATAWRPALDLVWTFIRSQAGLWTGGHNVFVYHHPASPNAPVDCEFGVEVTRSFAPAGEVYASETPAGEAVVARYRGPYNALHDAHRAIEEWMADNGRESGGQSWEIYGDPTPDPADTETTVMHLIRQAGQA